MIQSAPSKNRTICKYMYEIGNLKLFRVKNGVFYPNSAFFAIRAAYMVAFGGQEEMRLRSGHYG